MSNTKIFFKILSVAVFTLCLNSALVSSSNWKLTELWEDLPGENYVKFYIFNITNVDEFLAMPFQIKPNLHEIGPYVYRVHRYKAEASQQFDDQSIKFKPQISYKFEPNLSQGLSEDDEFNIVNMQLLIYGTRQAATQHSMATYYIRILTDSGNEKLIRRNEKVKDILFNGMNSEIYIEYEKYISPAVVEIPYPEGFEAFQDGRYSYFKNKNNTKSGELRFHAMPDENYARIISLNGEASLNWWNSSSSNSSGSVVESGCNTLSGATDGTIFPPETTSEAAAGPDSSTLSVYLPEICRSVNLQFNEAIDYSGIPANRFVFDQNSLNYSIEENSCFCTNGFCLKDGALDIRTCTLGAPYAISLPYFYNGDLNYTDSIDGLPNAEENFHNALSFIVVEPKTGTVLRFVKRFQLNGRTGGLISKMQYFRNFPDILFPILWMEETYELDSVNIASLKSELESSFERTTIPINPTTTTTTLPSSSPTTTTTPAPFDIDYFLQIHEDMIKLNKRLYYSTTILAIILIIVLMLLVLIVHFLFNQLKLVLRGEKQAGI